MYKNQIIHSNIKLLFCNYNKTFTTVQIVDVTHCGSSCEIPDPLSESQYFSKFESKNYKEK